MSEGKIARVYAEALYQAAVEEGRIEEVQRDFGEFVGALAASPDLRRFLLSEGIADGKKKEVVLELTDGGEPLLRNFLQVIVDKDRESAVEDAYREYVSIAEKAAGLVRVEVVSAVPLSPSLQEALKHRIESSLSKTVELKLVVDEGILGGLKLRIGDRVADASLRHRLERLRQSLVAPTPSLEGSVEAAC